MSSIAAAAVFAHKPQTPWWCPVPKCEHTTYPTLGALLTHLKKAVSEGDSNHIEIVEMEGWLESPLTAD